MYADNTVRSLSNKKIDQLKIHSSIATLYCSNTDLLLNDSECFYCTKDNIDEGLS